MKRQPHQRRFSDEDFAPESPPGLPAPPTAEPDPRSRWADVRIRLLGAIAGLALMAAALVYFLGSQEFNLAVILLIAIAAIGAVIQTVLVMLEMGR